MRVYCHFCDLGQVNSYLVTKEDGCSDALIIDPAGLDNDLIGIIERHSLDIRGILVTHSHFQHVRDMGKYQKIYPCPVYAWNREILGVQTVQLKETKGFGIEGFKVDILHVPGHSDDSLVYVIGQSIFTGDCLQAGRLSTATGYQNSAILARGVTRKIFSYDDNHLIFPGHGSPSKVRIEKMFNHDLLETSVSQSEELFQNDAHPFGKA